MKNNNIVDLIEINLFDLYDNNNSEYNKSLALEVVMQPIENTLNESEIKSITYSIIENQIKE